MRFYRVSRAEYRENSIKFALVPIFPPLPGGGEKITGGMGMNERRRKFVVIVQADGKNWTAVESN